MKQIKTEYITLTRKCLINNKNFSSPHDILKHLLKHYCETWGFKIHVPTFFARATKHHTKFAKKLLENLNKNEFNLMSELNNYFHSHAINFGEKFFSLWIGYFYYFKDFYNNLSNYEALKKKLIIPLSIFKKQYKPDLVDEIINKSEIEWYASMELCRVLGDVPIPQGKLYTIIKKLLSLFRPLKYDPLQSKYLIDLAYEAINTIKKLPLPSESHTEIFLTIREILYQSDDKPEWFELLKKIEIPSEHKDDFIEYLLTKTENSDAPIQTYAWELLDRKIHLPTEVKIVWIRSKMKSLNEEYEKIYESYSYKRSEYIDQLIKELVSCTMPTHEIENISNFLFEKMENILASRLEYKNTLLTDILNGFTSLPPFPFPSDISTKIVNKLLELLEQGYSAAALTALKKVKIPDHLQSQVMNALLKELDSSDASYLETLYITIGAMRIPPDYQDVFATKLLKDLNITPIYAWLPLLNALQNLKAASIPTQDIVIERCINLLDYASGWDIIVKNVFSLLKKIDISEKWRSILLEISLTYSSQNYNVGLSTTGIIFSFLTRIPSNNEQRKQIIERLLFQHLAKKKYTEKLPQVFSAIYEMQKPLSTFDTLRFQAKLEELLLQAKDEPTAISVRAFQEKLEMLNYSKIVLSQKLPDELALHTIRFLPSR